MLIAKPAALFLLLSATACSGAPPAPSALPSPRATPAASPTAAPTPPPGPISLPTSAQFSAPSGRVVWGLIGDQALFISTDSGDTWKLRTLPPTGHTFGYQSISFVDPEHGWALTMPAMTACQGFGLWRTEDGARTWQFLQTSGIGGHECLFNLAFADLTHAYLATSDPEWPVVYGSADGGRSWTAAPPLHNPPEADRAPNTPSVRVRWLQPFGGTVLVDAVGSVSGYQRDFIYRSNDAGATWSYVGPAPPPGGALAFATASRWIEVVIAGQAQETRDAGASWHAYSSDYSQAAPVDPQLVFGDAQTGYATVRGGLARTLDGGAHWVWLRTPGT